MGRMLDDHQPVLEFIFNNYHYSLLCTGWEDESLQEILKHIRVALNLPATLELKARIESAQTFLPQAIKLSEIFPLLCDNGRLEICIDNLSEYPAANAKSSAKSVRAYSNNQSQNQYGGRIVGHLEGQFESEIIHRKEKYFVMPYQTLRSLQDHLKNDFVGVWINRLCGTVLGAAITIFITLQNNSISEMFRSNLKTALFFCLFLLFILTVLERFGRPKDRRSLESLINGLVKEDDHHA
jgi:hypothetical protein